LYFCYVSLLPLLLALCLCRHIHNKALNNIIIIINVSKIPGNHEVKELHKTAILGTAHILRKVLT